MCHAHNTTSSTTPGVYTKQPISHLSPHSLICHYCQLKTPRMDGVRLKKKKFIKLRYDINKTIMKFYQIIYPAGLTILYKQQHQNQIVRA